MRLGAVRPSRDDGSLLPFWIAYLYIWNLQQRSEVWCKRGSDYGQNNVFIECYEGSSIRVRLVLGSLQHRPRTTTDSSRHRRQVSADPQTPTQITSRRAKILLTSDATAGRSSSSPHREMIRPPPHMLGVRRSTHRVIARTISTRGTLLQCSLTQRSGSAVQEPQRLSARADRKFLR